MNFHLVETDGRRPSVMALDDTEHLVAGAFYQGNYWHFYLTSTWADVIGVEFVPDHLPLFTKSQAVHWIELMATAYIRASEREAA